jgi:hypothetical protein
LTLGDYPNKRKKHEGAEGTRELVVALVPERKLTKHAFVLFIFSVAYFSKFLTTWNYTSPQLPSFTTFSCLITSPVVVFAALLLCCYV